MSITSPVLVVDDFTMMREIISLQLRAAGFTHIHTANSAEAALRVLEHKPIELILSDLSMPGMSGIELLEAVRRQERLKKIPFILVTAEMQRDRIEHAVRAGVDDFLLKPFKPEEFAAKVHAALGGRRSPARRPAPPPPTGGQRQTPVKARIPTLLVVDDAPNNLTLASGLLRDQYQVKLALRGDKALELCETSPPDLILLDIMMPEMDGFEVCRRLKANLATAHIPVLFLTALDDVAKTVEGLELGAVDYVAKPIEPAILKARVAAALRVAQAREELREQLDLVVENARLRENVEQMIRHDLKNPLAAIIGMAANLLSDASLAADQRHQVRAIERAAEDSLELINSSGDLWKMEQGRYPLTPQSVDLAGLIERIADETRQAFAARKIFVATALPTEPATIEAEALLIYSLLHNLAKNAAEAIKEGETVRIALTAGDSQITVSIHNPGEVPVEIRDRFFERYATHGKRGGSGLGTYSAKLIAEIHGGTIAMETSKEGGTRLTVTLPIDLAAPGQH